MSESVAYFCPECGSPSLQLPTLVGGVAECQACSWVGGQSDLVASPFKHDLGSSNEIAVLMAGDLRVLMAKEVGPPMALFLKKWGFLSEPLNPKQLARYLSAASREMLVSILKERAAMEKERINGS